MKQIQSSLFQKAYPRLEEIHEVTALGRTIGYYVPINVGIDARALESLRPGEPVSTGAIKAHPFSPAPKPGARKR